MRLVRLAAVFYGAMIVTTAAWAWWVSEPLFWKPQHASWWSFLWGLCLGVAIGLGLVALTRAISCRPWARDLLDWFGSILGPLSWPQIIVLSILSSVGEECLFRGALQPHWGLWITSAVFGLAHLAPERRAWPWTASALLMGVVFGVLAETSNNLAGPIAAHFLINCLNLRHITQHSRRLQSSTNE